MSRYFLEKIKIEGFRGINNESDPLELKFKSTSVNSVFAVNGSGKSSIFEALTYAIRGSIPKLAGLPANAKGDSYIANLFHSEKTATIELTFIPDDGSAARVDIKVVRDPNGIRTVSSPSGHANPEDFLASLDREFALVDYQTFSQFMADTPLDRGRSFSSLVGLAKYSKMRQALQSIADTRAFNSEFDTKALDASILASERGRSAELRALRQPYETLTGRKLAPELALDVLEKEIVESLSALELLRAHVEGKALADIKFSVIRDALIDAEGGPKRSQLTTLVNHISSLESIGEPDTAVLEEETKALIGLVDELQVLAASSIGQLHRKLYEDAKNVLASPEWTATSACPLCESHLDFELESAVDDHLAKLRHLVEKEHEIKEFYENSKLAERLATLEGADILLDPPMQKIGIALLSACSQGGLDKSECKLALATVTKLDIARQENLRSKREQRTTIEKELPPSLVQLMAQVDFARQISLSIARIAAFDKELQLLKGKRGTYARWQDFLGAVSAKFAEAEANLSSNTLAAIDVEHKRLFSEVMRSKNIVPLLERESLREDLQVKLSDFHGRSGLSAQALLSESYLNAFAISIFLAAAAKDMSKARFIVMDDVTSSFDSGHQWKLMEQIRCSLQHTGGGSGGLQFIILSHDGLLEKYFDSLGSNSNWKHQKLQGWPPFGSIASSGQDAGRLGATIRTFLQGGQVSEAAPLMRQYLEYKLLRVISKLQIPVPLDFAIKDSQKMVGNAITAIQSAMDLHQRAGDIVLEAAQVDNFEKRRIPSIVGNFTSHYATGSMSSFTPPLLLGIMDDIDDLEECFKFDKTVNGQVERTWYKSLCKKL